MIRATSKKTGSAAGRRDNVYAFTQADRRTSAAPDYLAGTAAPEDFWSETDGEERHDPDVEARIRRRREHVFRMNLRYAAFMGLLVAAVTLILIGYIKLQADISRVSREVASLQTQLGELRAANNENYAAINAGVDLEEVRRIAVQELGMKNAEKDQIILYSDRQSDMVRQVSALSN